MLKKHVVTLLYNKQQKNMKTQNLTFYKSTRYNGGRSHTNKIILQYVADRDIFQAAEYFRFNIYPAKGDNFENGVIDEAGNEIMDKGDYDLYCKTEFGRLDFGSDIFYNESLKNVNESEYACLPKYLQLEYINIWNDNVTQNILNYALENYSAQDIYNFTDNEWNNLTEEFNNKD